MPEPIDPTGEVFVEADDTAPESRDLPEAPEPRGALRTAGVVSGRVVLGLATLAAIAVVLGAAVYLPLPTLRSAAPSTVVTPVPTVPQLVCPGVSPPRRARGPRPHPLSALRASSALRKADQC